MEAIRIEGGHKFRVKFAPEKALATLPAPKKVALSARAYPGLKAKLVVKEGDSVKLGAPLFVDKKNRDVKFTAPAAGRVSEIRYGDRRRLLDVVIDVDGSDAVDFGATARADIAALGKDKVVARLVESGLWTQLRTFPGNAIPPVPGWRPEPDVHGHVHEPPTIRAVYVSALATEPHMASPDVALAGHEELFAAGLDALKQLAPKAWLFSKVGEKLPAAAVVSGVQHRTIVDKYPAENTGLQVFYTERLGRHECAVGVGVETVLDIGHLFLKGTLRTERTYAVAGKAAKERKHLKGALGVPVKHVVGEVSAETRVIAGGIFSGVRVSPDEYLSANETSLQVMPEDKERTPFVFQRLGLDRFTLFRMWFSGFFPNTEREATTSNNGEERACVQCAACIDICPVDLMPVLLMKASDAGDIEELERLGIHDCVDCGLCTFICPSKIELGQSLEDGKALIAKEG